MPIEILSEEEQRREIEIITEEIKAELDRKFREERVEEEKSRNFIEDLRICSDVTPGPWKYVSEFDEPDRVFDSEEMYPIAELYYENCENDAKFIAEAREGWPAALAEIKRLQAEVERMKVRIAELTESNAGYIREKESADDLLYEILDDDDCSLSTRELIEERTDVRG